MTAANAVDSCDKTVLIIIKIYARHPPTERIVDQVEPPVIKRMIQMGDKERFSFYIPNGCS